MLDQLVTNAPPKTREAEAVKGRARHEARMEREVRLRTGGAGDTGERVEMTRMGG